MLNDEICKLREKLNESIINGDDYSITYKLSVELDELIAKYYQKDTKKEEKKDKKACLTSK
ncbi:MAG: aspartyl-phosphate phosphatase Spo0E family protein [Clostridia bacterium]|nr:aspartyl-phosphate phosphatase Spo0E family protein [Clostridia bacterium]